MTLLEKHISQINKLCLDHNVKELYAFGSILTPHFNKESDVDLVVDFDPIDTDHYVDNYYDFKFSLEDMLKRPIDLLEDKAIKNPYFRHSINQQRKLIYGH
ncbi:MAG: nucleotidyltransferase domain-containing protein [Ferruginibacter sp.]